jgi:predicted AlkP superfamily pyrophosphatase or phosphodiesterase
MKRILLAIILFTCSFSASSAPLPKKPKLIVAIVVDQFRYDYLLRFRNDYTAGFKRLLEQGAVFDDAHHIHYPTVTAVGHSTFLSGATPSFSGIIANDWYDRETGRNVTSVSDPKTKLLGADTDAAGSSPRRMLVSTLGDEIKMSGQQSKVIGVSIKDRAAILPAGHMADGAYWFDDKSGHWVTSSYYMETLPVWVNQINESKPAAHAENAKWFAIDAKAGSSKAFCTTGQPAADLPKCTSIEATPWGNELIEDFAEHALTAEKLGQHTGTDILAVSFSANDYVGHATGPDSPEVRDMSIRTDRLLGRLLDYLDKNVGLANVMLVMTSDHGVVPVPEVSEARHMPGGRLSEPALMKAMEDALTAKYGAGKWIAGRVGTTPWLNTELIESKKLNEADVEKTAADAARKTPHVFRVYTRAQLLTGQVQEDSVTAALRNGLYDGRSGDIFVIQEPGYLYETSGTSHGTPFNYDSHVPVIFMGAGIKPGHYYEKIAVNDIAPTLAAIAGVDQPDGSIGRVLQEMWQ